MMIFYKINITIWIFLFPFFLSLQIIFTLGVSFFLSALNVFYRDVTHAIAFMLQLGMFISPIAYPVSSVPAKLKVFYMLNPMAVIINGYRRIIIQGVEPEWHYLLLAIGIITVTFILSYKYFKRVEMKFADII